MVPPALVSTQCLYQYELLPGHCWPPARPRTHYIHSTFSAGVKIGPAAASMKYDVTAIFQATRPRCRGPSQQGVGRPAWEIELALSSSLNLGYWNRISANRKRFYSCLLLVSECGLLGS